MQAALMSVGCAMIGQTAQVPRRQEACSAAA
jgi:hypothetical protein